MADIRFEVVEDPGRFDAAGLAAMDAALFPSHLRYGTAEYRARLDRPGAWLAVATHAAKLVGFALAAPDEEDPSALFLDVLATHPAWRRKGIAAKLVALCAARARELGAVAVRLTCEPRSVDGDDLVAIYGRLGFEVERRAPDYATLRLRLSP